MRPSKRLERIPPYAFAQLERKIAEKRAAGVDVISLGIGDPDRPTPALIVEAMQEAVTEAETHRYPSNRGREDFRGAVRDFYAVSYTHLRAHETDSYLVCRLLLEKKKNK